MKIKTYVTTLVLMSCAGFIPIASQADTSHSMTSNASTTISSDTHQGTGEVLAVDRDLQKIKLAHGPIESLNWGAMKMLFSVKKTEFLKNIKAGDNVNFSFIKADDGRFVITELSNPD
jgi:Cu(I)/Ag(I) efflux system periplasmic protein CusF